MADMEEDEWEYEYDENETEDFYIPIDLANIPEAQVPINAVPQVGHPVLLKSRLRAQRERAEADNIVSDPHISENSPSIGEIQISGFHTANPLIMYHGQLLSCQWARNIGTDLFFAKPVPDSETTSVLRSLPDVDLISTGSAKLVARVAQLRPRDDVIEEMVDEDQVDQLADTPGPEKDTNGREVRPAPNPFLARFNAAKVKRGDKTQLAISREDDGIRLVAKARTDERAGRADPAMEREDARMGGT
ncbi:hypothetical protein K458DRAFT_385626 [Lentithecium fluviatile CBS 122367]|uniref:Transcription factor TFIIIC triple barrel domain-containing protein n=1 Tax=Lentithecium fluviatile CBS 122367 TaxID=1168545 RepID=A0A6G1JC07_9PLEO|nr:hypothetical protein K458DRAFT_385626 [Lentithecium fluviatile CBS 122367]